MGGYRTGKRKTDFSWVDGSSWDFINWKIRQPDNANSIENYVMINFRYKSEKRQNKQVAYGLWNDAQEKWKVGYVCQIKKIPTTAAGPTTAAATTSSCLGAVSQCGDGTSTPLGTCCDGYECVPLSATAAYCAESSTSSTTTCGGSGSSCLDTTGAATYPGCCTGFSCTPPSSGTIFTCVQIPTTAASTTAATTSCISSGASCLATTDSCCDSGQTCTSFPGGAIYCLY